MSSEYTTFNPFAGPEIEYVVYTTKAQSEIWTACYLGGNDAARAYNESITLDFYGNMDLIAMQKAIQDLVDRHEVLRATFSTDGTFMSIFKQLKVNIDFRDLSILDESAQNKNLEQYIEQDTHHFFDLVKGPLIKVGLLKLSNSHHQLIITVHHLICDGWSVGILLQDLGIMYSAYIENKTPYIIDSIPFSTYAKEDKLFTNSNEQKEIENFWLKMYEHSIPILKFPTDNPRPSLRTYKSDHLYFKIDSNLLINLKQIGLAVGASFVSTLLTSFELFLYQFTSQEDLVVGLPTAGQAATGMNQLVGHCVNLLPLRSKIVPKSSFNDYLKKRKSELFDAYDHQQLSFGNLLQKLNVARDPSRVPLVPIVFNIDLGMTDGVEFSNLKYNLIGNPRAFEAFEIFLNATGSENELVFDWSYNKSLFKKETIKQMMSNFEQILQNIVEDPSKTIEQITFQDFTKEYKDINATSANYPDIALHDLFDIQAHKSPNKTALEFLDQTISYKSLQEQVNKLGHYFKAQGIASGDLIAVSLPRSTELIISLLAIMQCGAAYLPLDHQYPNARLEFMINDSEAKFLLTCKTLSLSLSKRLNTIFIENAIEFAEQYPATKQEIKVAPNDKVYLMYTSGSTGNPKGVPITHNNLVNFLCSMAIQPGLEETDRLLSITTISFDIAGLELYLPLIKGATLILANSETAHDARLLLELLQNKNISYLQATPTTWQMLIDSGWSKPLKIKALCGGEALPLDLAKKLLERCDSLWNVYGPTETTIWSSLKQIKAEDTIITIGKPIANTQLYIINEDAKLLAPGSIGEIAIGGDGLSKGYWKRQKLTDEKFIIKEFSDSKIAVLYRTGDLGKLLPNNEIICLGRLDQQVKIRGHRIEPGEVEQAILAFKEVKKVVVLATESHLIAHIVPVGEIETSKKLIPIWRENLHSKLPSHLVPQTFNLLNELPTTLNGKIDRKTLLEFKSTSNSDFEYTAPRTETEKLVSDIWKSCLKVNQIDIFSNFFEIGGHSLIAVKVLSKIEQETGERLPLSSLFEYSTIEKLAMLLQEDKKIITWDSLVPIKQNGTKTPLYIVHGAGLNVLIFNALAKNLDDDQPVYGLQAKGLNGIDEPNGTIEEMASYYIESIMKSNPNGPYALAGYSFGGIIAYEMAHQFTMKGKKVTMIGLLDTDVNPHYYYANPIRKAIEKIINRINNNLWVLGKMLTDWDQTKERFRTQKIALKNKLLEFKNGKEKQHEITYKQPYKLDLMNSIASRKYHLVPRNFRVDLFRVDDKNFYRHNRNTLGWEKVALQGVEVHDIPGHHFELFSPPNDQISARIVQKVLDQRNSNI